MGAAYAAAAATFAFDNTQKMSAVVLMSVMNSI